MKKVVLITGGTSGIGLGTVEYMLDQEYYELITVSRSEENILLAKEKLGIKSKNVTFLKGDISKIEDCKNIFKEI